MEGEGEKLMEELSGKMAFGVVHGFEHIFYDMGSKLQDQYIAVLSSHYFST